MTVHLTLHLLLAATAVSADGDPPPCAPSDHRCMADANVGAARVATSASERVQYLYRAHRAFLAMARKAAPAGRAGPLCRAAELLDEAQALPPPSSLRQPLVDTAKETADALESAGVDCSPPQKRRSVARRRVASRTAATTNTAPAAKRPEPANGSTPEPTPLATEAQPSRAPDPRNPAPVPAASPPAPAEGHPTRIVLPGLSSSPSLRDSGLMLVPPSRAPNRSGRGLVIAGSVTLGAGVALAAAAGVLGHRMIETRREVLALDGMIEGFATPEEAARGDALVRDYRSMGPPTLGLALAGGATVISAAILIGIGAKRLARRTSRAALVPVPGGLALGGRF